MDASEPFQITNKLPPAKEMTEQASYSGNCFENEIQDPQEHQQISSICMDDISSRNTHLTQNQSYSEQFLSQENNAQVPLTDSNEQQFDSHYVQNFVPIRCLGKGGFGVVFESRNKVDQGSYAVKRIKLPNKPGERKKAMREVRTLARLNNPNIVKYYSAWTETPPQSWQKKTDKELMPDISSSQSSESNSTSSFTDMEKKKNQSWRSKVSDFGVFFENINEKSRSTIEKPRKNKEIIDPTFLYIQMELCQKDSLQTWLANNHLRDNIRCLGISYQVLCAVEYLHDNNLIHRDLKPSNIMFSLHDVIKLGDFGLVTETDNEIIDDTSKNSEINTAEYKTNEVTHTKGVGTRLYMAPEQMSGNYGKEVDIFALGLILFEFFSVFSTGMQRICEFEKARHQNFEKIFLQNFRNEANLAKQMLSSQPSDRPTARLVKLLIKCFGRTRIKKHPKELADFVVTLSMLGEDVASFLNMINAY